MRICPSCQAKLADKEYNAGQCPICGHTWPPGTATVGDIGQTIDPDELTPSPDKPSPSKAGAGEEYVNPDSPRMWLYVACVILSVTFWKYGFEAAVTALILMALWAFVGVPLLEAITDSLNSNVQADDGWQVPGATSLKECGSQGATWSFLGDTFHAPAGGLVDF